MSARHPADWLTAAAAWPLAFAQVREDPWLDLAMLDSAPRGSKGVMIASGGCTAALLARHPAVGQLTLVDANPAQLGLTRLKLHLLESAAPLQRKRLLGHAAMPATQRRQHLAQMLQSLELAPDLFGRLEVIGELGLDYCGRYEQLFAALARHLASDPPRHARLDALLRLSSPAAQRVLLDADLSHWLESALAEILALPHLQVLFGDLATQNPAQPFHRHFAERLQWALSHLPAADNPYLWQMLRACPAPDACAPWLDLPPGPLACRWETVLGNMIDVLQQQRGAHWVHLSNILDWLAPDAAQATLQAARQALAPGGQVIVRQLNSTPHLPELAAAAGLEHDVQRSADLAAADRSFFYRSVFAGRRREVRRPTTVVAELTPISQAALAEFEHGFVYPLADSGGFRISHQPDYPRFFQSLGERASTLVLQQQERPVGVFSAVQRALHLPRLGMQPALYLGDLRLAPAVRRSRALWQLAQAMQARYPTSTAAFGVVMSGTAITPADYSGRLGLPAMRPLADLAVLQFATRRMPGHLLPISMGHGVDLFRDLAADLAWTLSGQPAARAGTRPQWVTDPHGLACGRLEDTALAKQLWQVDGRAMPCVHLANFVYRTPRAAVALLHGALDQAAQQGWPTLLTAVPWGQWPLLQAQLGGLQPSLSRATVYGCGLPSGVDWCYSTSEI